VPEDSQEDAESTWYDLELWNQLDDQRRGELADGMSNWGSITTGGWTRLGNYAEAYETAAEGFAIEPQPAGSYAPPMWQTQQPRTALDAIIAQDPDKCHYYAAGADAGQYATIGEDETEHGVPYVQIEFPGDTAKLISDVEPPPGFSAYLRHYVALANPNSAVKKAVIERDTDVLTKEQELLHWNDGTLRAAVKEELKVWIDHECFDRKLRRFARNLLDVRMVYKYKYVKREVALEIFKRLGVAAGTPADKVRVIRARMTLRGFKDRDAWMLETFAGTSSRLSKRIVVSEAVVQEFELWA
jgi:hypothetical protein